MPGITKENGKTTPTVPLLDVYENDREFLLVLDVPGVTQSLASVRLDGTRLVISAAAPKRTFERELVVPASVDPERVEATVKAGVLTVKLPKRAPQTPRQITVRAA